MIDTPPVIFLMGATACGKTELSLSIARSLDAEIISVDSALVYRGLDIGTAKPSAAERAAVPHHLIDICDPWEVYSAARFCDDALAAIEDIRGRGKRVLMVGGTMLYYKALEEGLAKLPDADPMVRSQLLEEAERLGWSAMHEQLAAIDPLAASRIHPNDPQRLQRALEVFRITGIPMSQLQAETHSLLDQPPLKFALVPDDRSWLHRRIALRFDTMLDNGFLDEMRQLRAEPAIHSQLPAMRSVGYRQAWEHLDECRDELQDELQDENGNRIRSENHDEQLVNGKSARLPDDSLWVDKAMAATRQLAKRQLTWLRSMSNVTVIACDALPLASQEQIMVSNINEAAPRS